MKLTTKLKYNGSNNGINIVSKYCALTKKYVRKNTNATTANINLDDV